MIQQTPRVAATIYHEQGSAEWHAERLGKVTASCFGNAIAKSRNRKDRGETAKSYMLELIGESLTGRSPDEIYSKTILWGKYYESEARNMYIFEKGCEVQQVGFISHPTEEGIGGSPDGLVGEDGVIEIKCPSSTKEHLKTLMSNNIQNKYIYQILGNMWVTGRQWTDFVSFHPHLPEPMNLVILRIERDEEKIKELAKEVIKFRDDMYSEIETMKNNGTKR